MVIFLLKNQYFTPDNAVWFYRAMLIFIQMARYHCDRYGHFARDCKFTRNVLHVLIRRCFICPIRTLKSFGMRKVASFEKKEGGEELGEE